MKADLPSDENARLAALRAFQILDTPQSDRFDRLTRIATHMFNVSAALVSLVDENRQWFKSANGIDATETDRDIAFCAHAILNDDVLVIPDATKDPRFSDNPLVVGHPKIRFYAGAPLTAPDGMRLGTFCIIDNKPHDTFSETDQRTLRDLAATAMDQIIIEKSLGTNIAVVANQQKSDVLVTIDDLYGTFVRQAPIPMIMLDEQLRILAQSDRWHHLWKRPQNATDYLASLRTVYPGIPERWFREFERCINTGAASAGEERVEITAGHTRCLMWEINQWKIASGARGCFLYVKDVTDQRKAEADAIKSEMRYQAVYRKTPAMMHSIDANGIIVEVSDIWLEKLGYKRDQVIGRPSTDFLTEGSKEYARSVVLPAFFQTGECDDVSYQFICSNGDIMHVFLTARAEYDEAGNIIRSVAVLVDVHELAALREQVLDIISGANT